MEPEACLSCKRIVLLMGLPHTPWSAEHQTWAGLHFRTLVRFRPKAEVAHAFESQCFSVALEVVGQLGLPGENRRDFLDHPLPEISKCASVRNKPLACFGEVASASEHWWWLKSKGFHHFTEMGVLFWKSRNKWQEHCIPVLCMPTIPEFRGLKWRG